MRKCLSSCIIKPSESTKHGVELQYYIQERTTLKCFQVNKIFAYDIPTALYPHLYKKSIYSSIGIIICLEKCFQSKITDVYVVFTDVSSSPQNLLPWFHGYTQSHTSSCTGTALHRLQLQLKKCCCLMFIPYLRPPSSGYTQFFSAMKDGIGLLQLYGGVCPRVQS